MVDDLDPEGALPEGAKKRGAVSFLSVISLGNVLILIGMMLTGVAGIYTVGSQVQRLEDSIDRIGEQVRHETELRVADKNTADERYRGIQQQEITDIGTINRSLISLRDDIRALTPNGNSQRR